MKVLLSLIFISVIFFACTETKEEDKKTENTSKTITSVPSPILPGAKEETVDTNKQNTESHIQYIENDSLLKIDKQIKQNFPGYQLAFYLPYENELYYYITNKKLNFYGNQEENVTTGIIDQNMNIVVPPEFDFIGAPDEIYKSTVVVKKNNLYGLYRLDGTELLKPKYDALYPVDIGEVYAQFKKGDIFGWIDTSRNEHSGNDAAPYFSLTESPLKSELITGWSFDNKNNHLLFLYDTTYISEFPAKILIVPSYIYQLGILNKQLLIINDKRDQTEGLHKAELKIKKVKSFGDNLKALIVAFFTAGPDARDYFEDEEIDFITVNDNLDTISLLKMHNNSYIESFDCPSKRPLYSFFGDTLIEVQQGEISEYQYPFHTIYRYQYYRLMPDGKIIPLKTNRFFPFTKFVNIDKSYFEGCFSKFIPASEDEMGQVEVIHHLSVNDLDVMRNEIFAEYGYKFKNEKWQNFFGQFDWYEPLYDNVDSLLTEKDKYNIKIILKTKNKIKDNEEEFLQKEYFDYYAAG